MIPPEIARIIDANGNRAREALRVMEEYARFVLNDPAGCEAVKRLRHELAEVMERWSDSELLLARDTPNDVGTSISTVSEAVRGDARSVFTAAAKRLPEALRAIEEYAKTWDAAQAGRCESIRYRAYELEQRLQLRGALAARFARVQLYVILTESLCRKPWKETLIDALEGGATCIQLREKDWDDDKLLTRAREVTAICHDRGALFVMNDRPDVARLCEADGVHLGQTDMRVVDARRIVGPDRLIGLSTHNAQQLAEAIACTPDYIAVGPMYPSGTKPQDDIPGVDLLRQAIAATNIPIVPIGGIDQARSLELAEAGARCVCVCSSVIAATEPRSLARSIVAVF